MPLTPGVQHFQPSWTQSIVWRGVSDVKKFQPAVDQWAAHHWDRTITANTLMSSKCPASIPYPQYFDAAIDRHGILKGGRLSHEGGDNIRIILNVIGFIHVHVFFFSYSNNRSWRFFYCSGAAQFAETGRQCPAAAQSSGQSAREEIAPFPRPRTGGG